MRKPSIRVQLERGTGQWIVVRYHRTGFNVLGRYDHKADAERHAQELAAFPAD